MMYWTSLLLLAFMATTSVASTTKQTYIVHMDKTKVTANHSPGNSKEFYETLIDSIHQEQETTAPPELLYVYETAISGFAAKLSKEQLELLKQVDGFVTAIPDEMLTLHTTRSPKFLGLDYGRGLLHARNLASDVIIGFIDSGIWPEHVSFRDTGMSAVPSRWKGVCEEGTKFTKSNCNRKIIGARAFFKGQESDYGPVNETVDYLSARDSIGHGTHTASTAAGNLVSNASLFGFAKGVARGMRYTSRIAVYKACWQNGCIGSDILAAVDKAVADGVDVLSISVGGDPTPYYLDSMAIAFFGATQHGVFVSCSAGNSGPSSSTVANTAPWIMTVAASHIDRKFPAIVKLGNGQYFEGSSLYSGNGTEQLQLVYGENSAVQGGVAEFFAKYCILGMLDDKLVRGKIVVCEYGSDLPSAGEAVKSAGGAGMIVINDENEGEDLAADAHILPTASFGARASKNIREYMNGTTNPTASIIFRGTVYGTRAPVMASFSSRGPNPVGPDVIKPDVTAPGVNILAAWPPNIGPTTLDTDKRSVMFNIISGTSMSCPHVSGLAALIKSVHKDWSPAAIKSALMTTAYTLDNRLSPITDAGSSVSTPATPFAFGSGHVNPQRASDPGLIYDITTQDYLNYLCSLNYDSYVISLFSSGNFTCPENEAFQTSDLNYPSFAVNVIKANAKNFSTTFKRTVTNVGIHRSTYAVRLDLPRGVKVKVEPGILRFYKLGQKLSYRVTVTMIASPELSSFGSLTWVSRKYSVRSPIAITLVSLKKKGN